MPGFGAPSPWDRRRSTSTVTKADVAVVSTAVAAVEAKFPITEPDIADAAVGTTKIANDAVTSPKAATGVVDGDTITGAVVQTSASGKRFVIDGPGDVINIFSGVANEVLPTKIDPTVVGVEPGLIIQTGTTTTRTDTASLELHTSTAGFSFATLDSSEISLACDTLDIGGDTNLSGDLAITGYLTIAGSGWIDLTLPANLTHTGAGFHRLSGKRVGDIIYLRGLGTVGGAGFGAGAVVATIPGTIYSGPAPGGITILGGFALNGAGVPVAGFRFDVNTNMTITTIAAIGAGAFIPFNGIVSTV